MAIKKRWQYQEYAQPVRSDLGIASVSLDRWFQPTEQPRFDIRRQQHLFPPFSFNPFPLPQAPESITLDKWFQPTGQPQFRVKPNTFVRASFSFDLITPAPQILLDKWFVPMNDPVRSRPQMGVHETPYLSWDSVTSANRNSQFLLLLGVG